MRDGDAYWLNNIMQFDHVIRVNPDGTIDEHPGKSAPAVPYAPESVIETRHDGQIMDGDEAAWIERLRSQGWEPEHGWSGQYGYSGPVMHASEFIGGGLADHIAGTPGLWVAVTVECLPDEDPDPDDEDHDPDDCDTCEVSECGDYEPAGWAVLHMDDGPETESYVVDFSDQSAPVTRAVTGQLTKMDLDAAREVLHLGRQVPKRGRIIRVTDLAVMPAKDGTS